MKYWYLRSTFQYSPQIGDHFDTEPVVAWFTESDLGYAQTKRCSGKLGGRDHGFCYIVDHHACFTLLA